MLIVLCPQSLIATTEEEKKKYLPAAQPCHASFTPFVVSIYGALVHETSMFLQWLSLVVGVKAMVMCFHE